LSRSSSRRSTRASSTTARRNDSLTASWLSAVSGADPLEIEARRRAGELLAFKPKDEQSWLFPAWQFDREWNVRPELQPVLGRARERGLDGNALAELLERRAAMTDRRRLVDLVFGGETAAVFAAMDSAQNARRQ
jgi:hypothetical protein